MNQTVFYNKRFTLFLVCVLLLIHIGALIYRIQIGPAETPDSLDYLLSAQNAANGLGFQANEVGEAFQEEMASRRPVGYPAFICLMQQSKAAVILFQVLLSLATISLCVFWVRTKRAAVNALLLGFILTPSQVIYATSIMSEIPFQFVLTLAFLSILEFFKKQKLPWFGLAVFALIVGFLIKPVLYPFTYFFFAAAVCYGILKKQKRIIPICAVPLLAVLTLSFFNYTKTGAFEVSSIQATNLLNVNARFVLYQAEGRERGDSLVDAYEAKAKSIQNYPERQAYRTDKAKQIMFEHPFITLYQFGKGCVLFFADPGRFDLANYFGLDVKNGFMTAMARQNKNSILAVFNTMPLFMWLILGFVLLTNLVRAVFFGIFIVRGKEHFLFKGTLACGIFYIMAVSGCLGVSRYALPIVPLLLIGASLGAQEFLNWKYAEKRI